MGGCAWAVVFGWAMVKFDWNEVISELMSSKLVFANNGLFSGYD